MYNNSEVFINKILVILNRTRRDIFKLHEGLGIFYIEYSIPLTALNSSMELIFTTFSFAASLAMSLPVKLSSLAVWAPAFALKKLSNYLPSGMLTNFLQKVSSQLEDLSTYLNEISKNAESFWVKMQRNEDALINWNEEGTQLTIKTGITENVLNLRADIAISFLLLISENNDLFLKRFKDESYIPNKESEECLVFLFFKYNDNDSKRMIYESLSPGMQAKINIYRTVGLQFLVFFLSKKLMSLVYEALNTSNKLLENCVSPLMDNALIITKSPFYALYYLIKGKPQELKPIFYELALAFYKIFLATLVAPVIVSQGVVDLLVKSPASMLAGVTQLLCLTAYTLASPINYIFNNSKESRLDSLLSFAVNKTLGVSRQANQLADKINSKTHNFLLKVKGIISGTTAEATAATEAPKALLKNDSANLYEPDEDELIFDKSSVKLNENDSGVIPRLLAKMRGGFFQVKILSQKVLMQTNQNLQSQT